MIQKTMGKTMRSFVTYPKMKPLLARMTGFLQDLLPRLMTAGRGTLSIAMPTKAAYGNQ
jgi:hypothetical protein